MSVETANGIVPRDHVVQFYERDDELVASVAAFLVAGLLAGEAAIVVATPEHAAALDGGLVRRAVASGRRVRIYGEMVALLWDAGHVAEAIELEALWNEPGRHLPFSLYCAYQAQSVADDDHEDSFRQMCNLHSAVVGDASFGHEASHTAVVARAEDARSFRCEPQSSSRARHFVHDQLMAWGRDAYLDDASIIVAELATNAVLHARSEFIVALSAHGDTVRVSVRDGSLELPAKQDPTPSSISGRGLVLVAAVAQQWGTELLPDGKVVRADLCVN